MQMLSNVFRKNADARRALFFQNNTIRQREKQCKLTGTFLQLPKNKVVIALCKETVADLTSTTNQDNSGINTDFEWIYVKARDKIQYTAGR